MPNNTPPNKPYTPSIWGRSPFANAGAKSSRLAFRVFSAENDICFTVHDLDEHRKVLMAGRKTAVAVFQDEEYAKRCANDHHGMVERWHYEDLLNKTGAMGLCLVFLFPDGSSVEQVASMRVDLSDCRPTDDTPHRQ